MIIFVHQPEYMPWLGFFDKLDRCDTFIVYDDAQYQHGGFHNRNRIRTKKSWEWLTIPIKHGYPQTIKEVKIFGEDWKNKHLAALSLNYRKAPYFREYFPLVEEILNINYEFLIELNLDLIKQFANALSIKANFLRSSEMPYTGKEKNEKLVSMCKFAGASTYLSGSGGKAYLDENIFSQANIKVQWHSYKHPIYQQIYEGFEPNMSIIDLLFNVGPKIAKKVLKSGAGKTFDLSYNQANLLNNNHLDPNIKVLPIDS